MTSLSVKKRCKSPSACQKAPATSNPKTSVSSNLPSQVAPPTGKVVKDSPRALPLNQKGEDFRTVVSYQPAQFKIFYILVKLLRRPQEQDSPHSRRIIIPATDPNNQSIHEVL